MIFKILSQFQDNGHKVRLEWFSILARKDLGRVLKDTVITITINHAQMSSSWYERKFYYAKSAVKAGYVLILTGKELHSIVDVRAEYEIE